MQYIQTIVSVSLRKRYFSVYRLKALNWFSWFCQLFYQTTTSGQWHKAIVYRLYLFSLIIFALLIYL